MLLNRKKNLLSGSARSNVAVATAFLVLALFTALAHAATETVTALDYDAVVVWGSAEVEIDPGDDGELRVLGSQRDLDRVPYYVRDGVLHLGRAESGKSNLGPLKFKLHSGQLRKVSLKGSGEVYVKPLQVERLEVSVEGSGDLKLYRVTVTDLEVRVAGSGAVSIAASEFEDADMAVSGSGSIDLGALKGGRLQLTLNGSGDIAAAEAGEVRELDVEIIGSGDVEVDKIRAGLVEVNVMGSGDVTVWAADELEVSTMGSGDVMYHGSPVVRSNILGSGDVESLD